MDRVKAGRSAMLLALLMALGSHLMDVDTFSDIVGSPRAIGALIFAVVGSLSGYVGGQWHPASPKLTQFTQQKPPSYFQGKRDRRG